MDNSWWQRKFQSLLFVMWITSVVKGDAQHAFGYSGETGPNNWSKKYSTTCAGFSQSPIDILPLYTEYNSKLTPLYVSNRTPKNNWQFLLSNTGNTAMVELDGDLILSGGNLPSKFKVVQFHFHWGSTNDHGSEHLIDGKAAPLEMHVVSYDYIQYKSFEEASRFKNALAVLAIQFQISRKNNTSLQKITDNLREIKWANRREKLVLPYLTLEDIIPSARKAYYRYHGSLTSPPCTENVIWTVLKNKEKISQKQLQMFRQLARMDDTNLTDNFRPPQELNGRTVFTSFEIDKRLWQPLAKSIEKASNAGARTRPHKLLMSGWLLPVVMRTVFT